MHALFEANYANSPMSTFLSDLEKKDGVFLVRRKTSDEIVGFSTLGIYDFEHGGKKVKGLFSGDTIIDRAYWGTRSLQSAFALKMFVEALKRPFSKQYWLLISKGYKTYLLLARNFPDHYPKRGHDDPELKELVIQYCDALFPGKLDHQAMVLNFGEGANCLKQDVALIDDAMRAKEPDIAYFEQRNPLWQRGTELPCIGRADLWTFIKIIGPFIKKVLSKPSASRQAAPEGVRSLA
ncbi:MAG: hypothetical protein KGL90_12045 [Burkholderiales bacterium]|nr:hypothetical protein [Burkholderiales bacterium]